MCQPDWVNQACKDTRPSNVPTEIDKETSTAREIQGRKDGTENVMQTEPRATGHEGARRTESGPHDL